MKNEVKNFILHWDIDQGHLCFSVVEFVTENGKREDGGYPI